MKTLPLSKIKMKLSSLVETVRTTNEEVVITKNGYPAAILVSPDEFEGWRETMAINDDQDLLSEIKRGVAELKNKQASLYTLEELFGE